MNEAEVKETETEGTELSKKIEEAETRAKRFEGMLADYEKKYQNIDPDKYIDMKERLRILEEEKDKNKHSEDPDKWKEEKASEIEKTLRSSMQKELDQLKQQAESATKKLYEYEVVNGAWDQIKDNFVDKTSPYVKDAIRKHIKKSETGDLIVVDEEGKQKYKEANKPFSVADWGEQFAEANPFFAKPKGKGGTLQTMQPAKDSDPMVARYKNARTFDEKLSLFDGDRVKLGNFIQQHKLLNK